MTPQEIDLPVQNDDLPEGWACATLPQFARFNMGQSPPGSTYNENGKGMPFFQGKADFGERHPSVRVWCTAPNKVAHPGDVLILFAPLLVQPTLQTANVLLGVVWLL
jgi:hypothetical protein